MKILIINKSINRPSPYTNNTKKLKLKMITTPIKAIRYIFKIKYNYYKLK